MIDLTKALAPFDQSAPVGPRLGLGDPDRNQIKHAWAQAGSGPSPEWKTVLDCCLTVLESRSKDLELAALATVALGWTQGLAGLARGLELMTGLQNAFGAGLHPGPDRAALAEISLDLDDQIPRILDVGVVLLDDGKEQYDLRRFRLARTGEEQEARRNAVLLTRPEFHARLAQDLAALIGALEAWGMSSANLLGDKASSLPKTRELLKQTTAALDLIRPIRPFSTTPPATVATAGKEEADVAEVHQAARATAEPAPAFDSATTLREARALARSGALAQAVALLDQARQRARSPRERFLIQLDLAEICLRAGKPGLARPLVAQLALEYDAHRLETWENPGLCARVLEAQLDALRTDQDGGDLLDRLCVLDPARGLRRGPG